MAHSQFTSHLCHFPSRVSLNCSPGSSGPLCCPRPDLIICSGSRETHLPDSSLSIFQPIHQIAISQHYPTNPRCYLSAWIRTRHWNTKANETCILPSGKWQVHGKPSHSTWPTCLISFPSCHVQIQHPSHLPLLIIHILCSTQDMPFPSTIPRELQPILQQPVQLCSPLTQTEIPALFAYTYHFYIGQHFAYLFTAPSKSGCVFPPCSWNKERTRKW